MLGLIEAHCHAIDRLHQTFDEEEFHQLVGWLAKYDRFIATGVGKSGLVARKFASSLRTYGVPAYFLHPTDILHGDAGGVVDTDALIFFSASGSTQELSEVLSALGRDATFGVYGNDNGALVDLTKFGVISEFGPEADAPAEFVPSVSFVQQVIIADLVALALARELEAAGLGQTHRGGFLGATEPWTR